ncbi:MAG: hypothetical protein BWY40_00575 [bacterium ADurb.Bin270]|jgi:hypothetical protein|nr:hypothetical protein [Myxococcales bacterium]OQA61562.1 MAG: hypothetical protein BWY40_00575 [bacterium ADurb.Bin270]
MSDKTGREQVRDAVGRLLGFIEHMPDRDIVCDNTGRMQGFSQDNGTFDDVGRRLLETEQPSWLIDDKKNGF